MTTIHKRLLSAVAALAAAAALSGCNQSSPAAAQPPAATTTNFSAFAQAAFAVGENAQPVNFDAVTLVYDVDTDPNAFASLLM